LPHNEDYALLFIKYTLELDNMLPPTDQLILFPATAWLRLLLQGYENYVVGDETRREAKQVEVEASRLLT